MTNIISNNVHITIVTIHISAYCYANTSTNRKKYSMKTITLLLICILIGLLGATSILAQDNEMTCAGHGGNTIASLQLCVTHAAHEGHIISQGIRDSLLAKFNAAQAAQNRGQVATAINILNAFIAETQAQAGIFIHEEHSMHMIEHAQRIIAALGT
jgi:hypothetical protein